MSGYKFDHKFRGTALIIGNEFKGQGLNERKGCLKDVEMAQELFKRLDFNVTSFKNLSAVDMKKKMEIGCHNFIFFFFYINSSILICAMCQIAKNHKFPAVVFLNDISCLAHLCKYHIPIWMTVYK
jgi:hypothetical protein